MEYFKLSVLLILFNVIKCWAMPSDELEDFKDFLTRTSKLDQNLRKGSEHEDEYDEDEAVSDHAWEESGKFEGDLILNDRQRRLIVENVAEGLSRNGVKDSTKRWPDNEVIYFIQREHFNGAQIQAIEEGIEDLGQASCVKFRPYKKGDRDAVVIQGSRRGCFSQVGYQGGYQVLNLSGRHPAGRGCFRHGTVVHELLHTLGFYHMQSSPDRDDFISVVWENIIQPARHNFRKYNSFAVSDFGVGYDYDSVLHYSRRAFSSNGQDTLVPKQSGASIGQRVGLSDKDKQKLNKMYCDADSEGVVELDEATEATIKKKKHKNKPFDGHGIGYHQGKAVAIKLLPTPATFKLLHVPTFHMFDYFSKTPQGLSTPKIQEEHRTGKQLIHLGYNNPIINRETDKPEKNQQSNTESSLSEHLQDLPEVLDGLTKIVKTHVYPSQSTDNLYKVSQDYGAFFTPIKYKNVKETVLSSIKPNTDENAAEKYINTFYIGPKTQNAKSIYGEFVLPETTNGNGEKSPFIESTVVPNPRENVKNIAPSEYIGSESFQSRPNYSIHNIPTGENKLQAKEVYALFGKKLHDDDYQKKNYNYHPTRFDHDYYTDLEQKQKNYDKLHYYDRHNDKEYEPSIGNSDHFSSLTAPNWYQPTYL